MRLRISRAHGTQVPALKPINLHPYYQRDYARREVSGIALATWSTIHLGKGSELTFILAKAESLDGELADHRIVTQHYGSGLFT